LIRDWEPYALSPREHRTIRALAEALYDPSGTAKLEPVLGHVIDEVQAWLAAPDFLVRTGLRALLFVIEIAPIFSRFGARTMSRLPLPHRVRYLARLDARGATSLTVWKTLLGSAYFGHAAGEAVMGLEAPAVDAPPLLRLGRAPRARAVAVTAQARAL
jgi:hypothetical protein